MSNMKKLLDIMNETTVSGSIAAGPAVGLGTQRRVQEEDSDDGTKAPDAPKAKEFGLWKNSVLAGAEQRDKKKSKKVAESKSEERNEMDTPAVQSGLKKMAARHNNENWTKEQLADLGRRLASVKTTRKNGYTEFNGIDKAIIRSKKVNELDCGSGQRQLKLAEENISEEQLLAKELARRLDLFMKGLDRDLGKKSSDRGIQSKTEPSTGAMREDNKSIGPDKNDPFEKGWRARYDDANPYSKGTKEYNEWQHGKDEREAQPNHYDESVEESTEQQLSVQQLATINEGLEDPKDNPCWKGYKPVGTKKKAGKTVPNCVPKEGMKERLKEFAPSDGDGGDDGEFDEDILRKLASQWFNGDEDPRVEQLLAAAGWEIGQDEGYDDEPGVFVVMSGDDDGRSYISWSADDLRSEMSEESVIGIGSKLPKSDIETFGIQKGRPYKINPPQDWKPGDRKRAVQQLIPTQDKKDHIRSRLGKHVDPVLPEQDAAHSYKDTGGTFVDRVVGEILNYQSLNNANPKFADLSSAVKSKLTSLGKDKESQMYQQALKQSAELSGKEDVTEGEYQGQYSSKKTAIEYAKEKVKSFRDWLDGIEIWSLPSGRFDVVHTSNSNGREHVIKNGGKKLGTIYPEKPSFIKKKDVTENNWSHDPWKDKYFGPTAGAMKKIFKIKIQDEDSNVKAFNVKAETEQQAKDIIEKHVPGSNILSVKFVKNLMAVEQIKETSNYGDLDEVAPPGKEDWIKSNKDRFKKEYGDKKGTNILYATAWADYNKKHGKK